MTKRLTLLLCLVLAQNLASEIHAKKNKDLDLIILSKISLTDNLEDYKSSIYTESGVKRINNGESLGFNDFIEIVKANHPDIISSDLEREIARYKRIEAQGAFDPSINSQNFFNRFNSSSAPGKEQEAFTSNTSLDFLTGSGAKFGLGAKLATGDIKTPISPTGDTGEYFIKMQIPLLRDAIYNSKSVKEKTTKLNEIIADYLLFRTKLKTLDSATKAYWDWVASKKILDTETNLLKLISNLVDFVQEQANLGNQPQISVVEAKREVQKRQGKVNSALRLLQESSIELAKFTWTETGNPSPLLKVEQVPVEINLPTMLIQDEIEDAKLNALTQRPEFKALDFSREISNLERKLAKNQMLPQLDAYVSSGLETGQDSIDSPVLEAGVNISVPLRVRTAHGQMQQAKLKIKQLNLKERQLIQSVFLEIEDAASAMDTSYQRFLAAQQDYELSLKLEEGEEERFKLGNSTVFLVIRRQRATVEANIELIKTITDYHKARIRFLLVQGELV